MNKATQVNPTTAFKLFQRWMGGSVYLILILSIVAAVVESLGITTVLALLPFILSDDDLQGPTFLHDKLSSMFALLGIDFTPLSLFLFIIFAFLMKGILNFATFGLNAYLRSKLLVRPKSELIAYVSSMDYEDFLKKKVVRL